ncbi:hypothetical protein RDABS01_001546 [Bienertia sinuspersici]
MASSLVNGLATKYKFALKIAKGGCDMWWCVVEFEENDIHAVLECPVATEIWDASGLDIECLRKPFSTGRELVTWCFENFDDNAVAEFKRAVAPMLDSPKPPPLHGDHNVKWKPPPPSGLWKLNSDAGQTGDGSAGLAFVVRDAEGDLVEMGVKECRGWGGAEIEEARALYYGLLKAWECGYRRIMAENDCLSLISKLKKGAKLNSAVGLIVSDILSLASYFDFCSFSYVRREGNSLAHNVAKRSVNLSHEVVWLENFPDFATHLASQDMIMFLNNY